MSDLRDLYQSLILDHGQNPRNKRSMDCHEGGQCRCTEGYNPLCGDKLTLFVKAENGVLEDLSFEGDGCAIFTASSPSWRSSPTKMSSRILMVWVNWQCLAE